MILKDRRLQHALLPDMIMKKMVKSIEKKFMMSVQKVRSKKGPSDNIIDETSTINLKETDPDKTALSVRQPIGRSDAAGGNPG